jgi:hypothetical protein
MRMQMDADAMDPSKCMPPMYFEDHQALGQQSDLLVPSISRDSSSPDVSNSLVLIATLISYEALARGQVQNS